MTLRWELLPEAEEELREASVWYEEQRAGLGVEFLGEIESVMHDTLAAPLRWPLWRRDERYRRIMLRRFPYVLFYEVRADVIEFVAVAHARRKPGYWLDRQP